MPTSFKIIFAGLILTVVGFFAGIQDLRLNWSGRRSTATISEVLQNRDNHRLRIDYSFSDEEGLDRSGSFNAGPDWKPPADMKIPIVYLSGKPESVRTVGELGYKGVYLFLLGIAITVAGFVYFNRESVTQAHRDIAADNAAGPLRRGLAGRLLRALLR